MNCLQERKYNCPSTSCRRRYDALEDVFQHAARAHRLDDRYIVVDKQTGSIWTLNRMPSQVTEKGKEQLQEKIPDSPAITVAA